MELSEWDFSAVASKNAENVKALGEGASAELWAAQEWILIGQGHPQEYYDLVNHEDSTVNHGNITKTRKATLTDPGTLTISGIPGGRGELEEHISGFSKKKVVYS